jgi:hypothetical protein
VWCRSKYPTARWGYGCALSAAVSRGQESVVRLLIQSGPDVNMRLVAGTIRMPRCSLLPEWIYQAASDWTWC